MTFQAPPYIGGALFRYLKTGKMIVPFVLLLLVLVLITWFIATALKKKKKGEPLGEREAE